MNRVLERIASIVMLAGISVSGVASAAGCADVPRQPATKDLMQLLAEDPALSRSLKASIVRGQEVNSDPKTNPVSSIEDYFDFIDALVTYSPQNMVSGDFKAGIRVAMDGANYCNWNILDLLSYGYFLVDRQLTTDPRGQLQFMSPKFGAWLRNVAEYWGQYLETKPSAVNIPEFTSDPNFGDWYCPPKGGYTTFQAFFTRELCPTQFPSGSRPVHGYDDPNTVASIGDSISAGWWPISTDGKLVTTYDSVSQVGVPIKGKLYNDVHDFIMGGEDEKVLEEFGSIDPDIFNGGIWTHQFLNVNNYHRLHLPVAGEIIYLKHIQSGVRLKSAWVQAQDPADTSYYDPQDTPDWQFGQTRMVIGIKTRDFGTVIISPMGMAQVSSIEKRKWVVKGAKVQKGWEFANFAFGGSDFVIIFQPEAKFVLTAPTVDPVPPGDGVNYALSLQGTKYGCFGGNPDCSDKVGNPPAPPEDK
jgi:phosphatidylserine decarboxylase